MPAALALVTSTFPDGPKRDRALGIYSGVAALAALLYALTEARQLGGPHWPPSAR
jgi:hypothetical protein